ncbi:MAG: transcriptional regulator [Nitrososphaera sp.]
MASNNRTHISIIADILDTVRQYSYEGHASDGTAGGASVTHLIRRANVPHRRLSAIVSELKASGLLSEQQAKYRISDKGLQFLNNYNQFRDFAESFGLKI